MNPENLSLKGATAEMIKGVGGVEAAAGFCRVGKSVLSDNQSINRPESFVAVDVVAALEPLARERSGWPHVTRALCRQMGGVFVPVPEVSDNAGSLLTLLGQQSKENADVGIALCEALAGDNRIDGREASRIRGEIWEAIERYVAMDAVLAQIAGGEA